MPAVGAVERDAAIHHAQRDEEDALTRAIVQLASQYGRYGYRRITAVLQRAGWKAAGGQAAQKRQQGKLKDCLKK